MQDSTTDNQQEPDTTKVADPSKSFEYEIDRFIRHMDSLRGMIPLVLELVSGKIVMESRAIDNFMSVNKIEEMHEEGKDKVVIPSEKIKEFFRLDDKLTTSIIAGQFLPINFVVAFVSQYDAYLGRLIRAIFLTRPQLLNESEKNISFSELLEFGSMEEAKDFVIEKEVEAVLRESHLKQFKWLENKLKMKLREELPSFTNFLEITERRNLFVHCNGVVSRQYLLNCKDNHVKIEEGIQLGSTLNASPIYLGRCYSVLLEIGVKLGHVIWRKLLSERIEDADLNLNQICFDLLLKGQYKLAINLLNFATETLKKHYDQDTVLVFVVNKALAYYLSGNKRKCNSIIEQQDWSATADTFKLAISVLQEKYDEATDIMKILGPQHNRVTKEAYMEWPLFKNFRETKEFKATYRSIFREDFGYVEDRPQKLEELIENIRLMKLEAEENQKNEEMKSKEE